LKAIYYIKADIYSNFNKSGLVLIDHILITNFSYENVSFNIIFFNVNVKLIDKLALQKE